MQPFAEQTVLLILLSVMLDLIIGDPKWLPHPVILFGKIISTIEKAWNKGGRKASFLLRSCLFLFSLFLCFY
jgi:adenosylcobinamide-phosphate synthase